MDPMLLGAALLAIAAALIYFAEVYRQLERSAVATGVSTVADIMAVQRRVDAEVGARLFAQRVGLEGTLECDNPLTSELGDVPCAAFRYRVERRWEEEVEYRDDRGNPVRRTRSGSDSVAANERRVSFRLRDETGSLQIDPEGARLEMEHVVDRFEPGDRSSIIRFGGFQLDHDGRFGNGKRRTLGYHFQEDVLPIGRTVYVLGLATDRDGTLRVSRMPHESNEPFLVSLRSRAEVAHAARKTMMYARYAAYVCAPVGLLLVLLGLWYRR
jgi:hypothetical protein